MARAWQGEFTAFYEQRAAALRRTAYLLCGNWHDAEDLTQAALLKLYRAWPRVNAESPDGYARRILVNQFLSSRRRRREQVMADLPDEAAPPGGSAEDRIALLAALRSLTAQQRAVVVLRYWEGLSIEQTARLLGMAEGSVKSQAARGIAALRERYAPQLEGS
jgi:RNA polymerase sigma-70 factor (sigma-E family)